MSVKIIENKKEYLVKKNTYFFRRAETTNIFPNMFFGFSAAATASSKFHNGNIQVWKTLSDFSVLYAVKKYLNENHPIYEMRYSSLPDIYLKKYSDNLGEMPYLSVKKEDNQTRNNLLAVLKAENVFGWVTSLEDKHEMELFLFDTQISQLIKFQGYTDYSIDLKLDDKDYFSKSNIIFE